MFGDDDMWEQIFDDMIEMDEEAYDFAEEEVCAGDIDSFEKMYRDRFKKKFSSVLEKLTERAVEKFKENIDPELYMDYEE